MSQDTQEPVRIGVAWAERPARRELRTMAALLLRTRLPLRVVAPAEAAVRLEVRADGTMLVAGEPLEGLAGGAAVLAGAADLLEGTAEADAPRDEFGRVAPPEEIFTDETFPAPRVDEWAAGVFGGAIAAAAGIEVSPAREWFFCATFDVDSAGMFRGKNLLRTFRTLRRRGREALPVHGRDAPATGTDAPKGGGWIAALWKGGGGALPVHGRDARATGTDAPDGGGWLGALEAAARVKARVLADPGAALRELGELFEGIGVPSTFFVQTHRVARLDSYHLRDETVLVRQLRAVIENAYHEVGLHSSFATREFGSDFFRAQWLRLGGLLGAGIAHVHRAHYLRVPDDMGYQPPFPGDWVDSSLAFGARACWRRGTCLPFRAGGHLIELPPSVMDTQLRYHHGLAPEAAFTLARAAMARVANVGGVFVPIWHPHQMEELLSPGWRDVLLDLVDAARKAGATFAPLAATARRLQHDADTYERDLERALP